MKEKVSPKKYDELEQSLDMHKGKVLKLQKTVSSQEVELMKTKERAAKAEEAAKIVDSQEAELNRFKETAEKAEAAAKIAEKENRDLKNELLILKA